jgi:hypothetical protein
MREAGEKQDERVKAEQKESKRKQRRGAEGKEG